LRKKYLDFANLEIFTFKIEIIPPDLVRKINSDLVGKIKLEKNIFIFS